MTLTPEPADPGRYPTLARFGVRVYVDGDIEGVHADDWETAMRLSGLALPPDDITCGPLGMYPHDAEHYLRGGRTVD